MHFHEPPKTVLKDIGELHAFPAQFPTHHPDIYSVKSVDICALIERMFSEKGERFAYNSDILKRAMQEFGLPPSPPNGVESGILGSLVYNAQHYAAHDWLVSNGYLPFTQEIVNQAGESGKKLCFQSGIIANVRKVVTTWYAFPKGKRKYAFRPDSSVGVKIA